MTLLINVVCRSQVQHYVEKPSTFVSTDINAGVYVMTPAIFNDMKTVFLRNHDAGGGQREQIGLERDVLTELAGGVGPCRFRRANHLCE